ncbi:MAG: DUF2849 domain-containing protein [Acetobacter orientalis]|uniref:DUF2849 domain-containing protein n=1 Tax=Acetobacter orientalis TaxID=146474 RepID=A0A252A4Z3_9PROT|nr:DUF2849 domain-containing protein [Acetobacter orientalis]OUI84482.1 hypothetical protein HK12_00855 [Acetobacter orientalis]OUI99361.1 hypothetical protein HK15_11540 [Acetobacter orientalis]
MDRRNSRRDAQGQSVLTANRLLDGRIVWLAADGSWQLQLDRAKIFSNDHIEAALAEHAALAQQQELVGVYGVQVHENAQGILTPVTSREQIRAAGPSVHPEFVPTWHKPDTAVTV